MDGYRLGGLQLFTTTVPFAVELVDQRQARDCSRQSLQPEAGAVKYPFDLTFNFVHLPRATLPPMTHTGDNSVCVFMRRHDMQHSVCS